MHLYLQQKTSLNGRFLGLMTKEITTNDVQNHRLTVPFMAPDLRRHQRQNDKRQNAHEVRGPMCDDKR